MHRVKSARPTDGHTHVDHDQHRVFTYQFASRRRCCRLHLLVHLASNFDHKQKDDILTIVYCTIHQARTQAAGKQQQVCMPWIDLVAQESGYSRKNFLVLFHCKSHEREPNKDAEMDRVTFGSFLMFTRGQKLAGLYSMAWRRPSPLF